MKYCTLQDVEAELRASENFTSSTVPTKTQVENWIEQESDRITVASNRVYGEEEVTNQLFDYFGEDFLSFDQAPVTEVGSVEYNEGTVTDTSFVSLTEGSDYILYEDRGQIKFVGEFSPDRGEQRFRVSYTYGYESTPGRIRRLCSKLVAKRVLESLVSSNVENRNTGGTVSVGSIRIVEPEDYGIGSYRALREEAEKELMSLSSSVSTFRNNIY